MKNKIVTIKEIPQPTFLESYLHKKFVQMFVKYEDLVKAYQFTYNDKTKDKEEILEIANNIFKRPELQAELNLRLPTEDDASMIYNQAFKTRTPSVISWGEKLKAADSVMRIRGYLGSDRESAKTNVNIGVVIKD